MRRLIALSALLLAIVAASVPAPAPACPPGARVCVPVVQPPAVIVHHRQPVAVVLDAPFVRFIDVRLAQYSLSYAPPAADNSALVEEVRKLREENRLFREEVIRSRGAAPAVPTVPPVSVVPAAIKPNTNDRSLVALLTVCAACHQPATAKAKGGEFVMFSDKGEVLDLDVPARAIRQIKLGKMPKGDTFNPTERQTVCDYLAPQPEQLPPPKE